MIIKIDFNSDEALYIQLRNQIIMGIATSQLTVGDSLPSVRQLADNIGINMHTVNKAYSVLRQEGYIKLDRRKGAVVAIDYDQVVATGQIMTMLQSVLAEAICKDIQRDDIHAMVDEIYDEFERMACGDYNET
ncbi:GntR family transcriptional regulator [Frisingicoccus sp.]|uniref:GntR family transcriptional regulator n=1 Tax=Frisingicoccus sp. TaxID=1918627 RepID=UPI0025C1F68B|nr:GntR family transcriptional regulator [Frisingicoccus sp.]MDY5956782.1 GntR family transcriptional regulator [Frisingicoccus sp.]